MKKPLVSVCCITYNHSKYIADTLESIVSQKTNFSFEIIVHDDASTDNTQEIIKEYASKYPKLFVTILQNENQQSKGKKPLRELYKIARGEYIAICEGDDYWTDNEKLQKQVDYMRNNPDCSMCLHAGIRVDKNGEFVSDMIPYNETCDCRVKEYFEKKDYYPTASLFFKTSLVNPVPKYFDSSPVGDEPLKLLGVSSGYAHYMNEKMCAYRVSIKGSWTSRELNTNKKKIEHKRKMLKFYETFNKHTKYVYNEILDNYLFSFRMVNWKNYKEFRNEIKKYKNVYKKFNLLRKIKYNGYFILKSIGFFKEEKNERR